MAAQLSAPLLDAEHAIAGLSGSASRQAAGSSRNFAELALREAERASAALKPKSKFHQAWRIIDDYYIKPYVGGQMRSVRSASDIEGESNVSTDLE